MFINGLKSEKSMRVKTSVTLSENLLLPVGEQTETYKTVPSLLRRLLFILVFLVLCHSTFYAQVDHESTRYFPKGYFSFDEKLDQFIYSWYSGQLRALKEPSIYELYRDEKVIIYRFLCLRTFHNPFSVRVHINDDGIAFLYYKRTDGAGGYDPGKLVESHMRVLNENEKEHLLNKIKNKKFWVLPAHLRKSTGCDGSEWIIEGAKNGMYHLVDRWTPQSGNIRNLGLYFIKLAGVKIDKLY